MMVPRRCNRVAGAFEPGDVGLGAFYYFASVHIIGVMSYAGYGRSPSDMALFFAVLVAAMLLTHLAMTLSERVDELVSEHVEPRAAVIAALVVACAGISTVRCTGIAFLLVGAVLAGGVCAATVGRWMATSSLVELKPTAFQVSSALLWAVAFYVVYRIFQLLSASLASGWQVAVPLVGMAALLTAYAPDWKAIEGDFARRRSFLLLVGVGAIFATCAGFLGLASDYPGSWAHVEFTPMVFAEMAGVVAIAGVCAFMGRCGSRVPIPVGRLLVVVPAFVLGGVSGVLPSGVDTSNFLWEASVWVLLLAVFVCGMRTSLFALRGLAVGVMWEAWCVGQASAHLAMLVGSVPLFALIAAMYVLVVFRQMEVAFRHLGGACGQDSEEAFLHLEETAMEACAPYAAQGVNGGCARVARRYGLSARETEVLALLGEGRSAKYISEALIISFNTARSHIRHIYEKLDVHSKQELIDLIKVQEG